MFNWMRIVATVCILGLVLMVVTTPYSLNIKNVMAQENSITKGKNISFFGNEKVEQSLQHLVKNNKDEALETIQQSLESEKLNISTIDVEKSSKVKKGDMVDGLAYPIKSVRKNKTIQNYLQQMIHDGEKVYLYGENVTFNEYKKLLGLTDITVEVLGENGKSMEISLLEDEANKEKGGLKDNPNSLAKENEDEKQVIGYSLDNNAVNKIFTATINNDSKNGKLKLRNEDYIQAILDDQLQTMEIEKNYQPDNETALRFLQKNTASAGRTLRKDSYDHVAYAKYNYTTYGKVYTDWKLYQQTSESVSGYDYFTVKEYMQPYSYNGSYIDDVKVDHDIPYDSDEIGEWGPDDSGGPTYSVGLSYPFSISYTFSMGADPYVNEQGSQYYDYARWTMSSYGSGERFIPSTGWKSSGTYASMDIRDYVDFHVPGSQGSTARAYQKIDVNYNY